MNLTSFLLVSGLLLIAAVWLKRTGLGSGTPATYRMRALVSPAERSFLGVLEGVLGDRARVFTKVRIADVLQPDGVKGRDWWRAFNRISAKHFDFLVCRPDDLAVLCAIELDDASHSTEKRQARDRFVEEVCRSAGLPLLRQAARSSYRPESIRESIAELVPGLFAEPEKKQTASVEEGKCPRCTAALVQRRARKGQHAGKLFLACSNFPKCRYLKPLEEAGT